MLASKLMKLRKKPIDDFGDERYIARLKLSSKDERRIKKWVQQLARECTGDSRAKLKIDELIFQIKSTRDNESWFRIPQFEVNGRVISGGETFDLWIVN